MLADIPLLDRHLLLQLGERLRSLRKARGMTAEQLAQAAGISRKTLRTVETGDATPAIGTYLRVMAALGLSGELALLASGALSPGPPGSAAARSRRAAAVVKVEIGPASAQHQAQDQLSLALHQEAVSLLKREPQRVEQALQTLAAWIAQQPASRAMPLWREWQRILREGRWQKVLASTARAQQLRQASPLAGLLPEPVRSKVYAQFKASRQGLMLDSAGLTGAGQGACAA